MKKGKFFLIFLAIVFAFAVGIYLCNRYYSEKDTEDILRLHILANSNSAEDQALKLKVRDYISGKLFDLSKDALSAEDNVRIIKENKEEIRKDIQNYIVNEGYNYDVNIEVGNFCFPTKYHVGGMLPAGKYEAVRIIIGEGKGDNWWCVLFPPLSFSRGIENDDKQAGDSENDGENLEVKFKIIEIFQDIKIKFFDLFGI